jgi:hypothetical protein
MKPEDASTNFNTVRDGTAIIVIGGLIMCSMATAVAEGGLGCDIRWCTE